MPKPHQNLIKTSCINWIKSPAWENISEQVIITTFLSCGISNKLDAQKTTYVVSDKFPSLDDDELSGERPCCLIVIVTPN